MFIKNFFFFILIELFSLPVYSQQENVNTIFNKIVNTIGNNFNGSPKLEIIDTENNPAYFLPNEKKIFISLNGFDWIFTKLIFILGTLIQ